MALRMDQGGTFASVERTPTGGVKIAARVSRIGVLPYTFADGSTRRELRHPDEVFDPASLASLEGAAVTDDHPPPLLVTPETWRQYAIGHVGARGQAEGSYVGAPVLIQDAKAVADIGTRLVECSCAYDADFDPTPGLWNGEPYDGVQRKIRYNHVALGPVGWGRAGENVALRLDSDSAICADMSIRADSTATLPTPSPARRVRVDGIDYDAGSDSHLAAVDKQVATLVADRDREKARADAAEKSAKEEKTRADAALAAASPAAIARAAAARADLMTKASRLKIFFDARGIRVDKKTADEAPPADMSIVDEILKELGVDVAGLDDASKMLALKVAWGIKHGTSAPADDPAVPADAAPNADPNKPPVGPPLDSRFVMRDAAQGENTEAAALKRRQEKDANRWRHAERTKA